MNIYPNGFGGTATGDALAAAAPVYTSGSVLYVSATGNDLSSGLTREAAFLTLAQAIASAVANDLIVLMSGFSETIDPVVVPAGVTIVGEGTSGGVPTCTLTQAAASANVTPTVTLSKGAEVRNVRFAANTVDNGQARVQFGASGCVVSGCYFDCGAHELVGAICTDLAPNATAFHIIEDCTFVSIATSTAALPDSGIEFAANLTGARVSGCVFDDGAYGFAVGAINFAGDVTALKMSGCTLRGATVDASASTTGYINPQVTTGGGRVNW